MSDYLREFDRACAIAWSAFVALIIGVFVLVYILHKHEHGDGTPSKFTVLDVDGDTIMTGEKKCNKSWCTAVPDSIVTTLRGTDSVTAVSVGLGRKIIEHVWVDTAQCFAIVSDGRTPRLFKHKQGALDAKAKMCADAGWANQEACMRLAGIEPRVCESRRLCSNELMYSKLRGWVVVDNSKDCTPEQLLAVGE